ncbi:MAG TPA: pentapeptide repeat-containing protein [Rubrobacteraceae bacterium]|jgi:uncharacterized protein YjbI with pentapeptide repeats|nr:pentapeptide repeat-containing protein [Rubrobacteraceae bacterium]
MEPLESEKRRLIFWEVIFGVAVVVVLAIILYVLWQLLNNYIAPGDDPTQRKDLVQAFAVIVGGVAAFGTLLIGWRTLRLNQRNLLASQRNMQRTLSNAQELENQRAQSSALQSYFEQMGDLLLDKKLRDSAADSEVRILAEAQTHTVLPTLNSERKASVLIFLYKNDLIRRDEAIINLSRADLKQADLSGAYLFGADLSGADLHQAILIGADLRGARLQGANFEEANLSGANLSGANLMYANLYEADLHQASHLTQEQLEQAFGDEYTKLPEYLERPKSWVVYDEDEKGT